MSKEKKKVILAIWDIGEIEVFASLSVFLRKYSEFKRHVISDAWSSGKNYQGGGVMLSRQNIIRTKDLD